MYWKRAFRGSLSFGRMASIGQVLTETSSSQLFPVLFLVLSSLSREHHHSFVPSLSSVIFLRNMVGLHLPT